MNENDKTYSPIKNRSYSFIGNTQNISSCRPLFSQEETKYNTYETNINQNTNNKARQASKPNPATRNGT
jgi:hypothetical protein